jgi:capsule polysaccharide export protein KpsE/RkpR
MARDKHAADAGLDSYDDEDDGPGIGLVELFTWIGEGKRTIAIVTGLAIVGSLVVALLLPKVYTARTTLLPPNTQQSGNSAAMLAALGPLGGLAGGLAAKTPDELYVALLKSDSVQRALADRFDLKTRYDVTNYEALRKALPKYVRVAGDKKSGVITVEVDDEEPKFAAELANAHATEITKVLGRLAVSEAQLRRVFFEQQLKDTKEHLIKAEQDMQRVQEKSGVIVLDKQAEALIGGAAMIRAQIAEREVQLKVLRGVATEQNPDVQRVASELRALRSELSRMESSQGGNAGSAVDMPVGKLPEAAIDYVRARRELKLQEMLLEGMLRQYEMAKLDEAKEGPVLQQIDVAAPPDYKSKPSRGLIVVASALLALLGSALWVVVRRYSALSREQDPQNAEAWRAFQRAWSRKNS